jgi:acyl carrier protein
MSDTTEIIAVLIEYIRKETGFDGPLAADDDLLSIGVLDSFNIVTLALFAQERFEVELEGEDLVRDNLARLSSLAALIFRRRAEQA